MHSQAPDRFASALRSLGGNAALLLAYALLAKPPALVFAGVSPFWPPAALAVFAALVWGWRGMPGIFLGSLWVSLDLFHWGPVGAVWVSLGNVLAPMIGKWGIRDLPMHRVQCWHSARNISRFVLWMGPVQAGISASFGVVGARLSGLIPPDAMPSAWFGWTVGDASATLMLVPVAHLWWLRRKDGVAWRQSLLAPEGLIAFAVSVAIWAVVFFAPGLTVPTRIGVLAAMLLPAIWSVFRLEQWLALLHLALAFILVLGATLAGFGPYAGFPPADAVVGVELLGLAMSAAILFAGALQSERQRALSALQRLNRALEQRAEERAQELLRSERNFRDIIEHLPAPTVITQPHTARVIYANPAACALFGAQQHEVVGRSTLEHWTDAEQRAAVIAEVAQHRTVQNHEIALRRLDGSVVWVLASVIQTHFDQSDALLFAFKDITEQVQRERLLQTQAQTDALTGVPNRRHFMARATQRLRELAAQRQAAAFVLFDLDDFKQINDTHGHACGDLVLQRVARLLDAQTRAQDVFARLGGEEFCLLLTDIDAAQARAHVEMLCRELDGQVLCAADGQRIALPTCSIGMAWAQLSPAVTDVDALLSALMERADAALYDAKSAGKNCVVLADERLTAEPHAQLPPRGLRRGTRSLLPLSLLRTLAAEVHFGRFFERVAQAAAQLVGADGAALIERDGDQLSYRFFHGLPEAHQQRFTAYRFPLDRGTVGQVVREGKAAFHADYARAPGALPEFVSSGLKANYLVPVRAGMQVIAVLAIAWFSAPPVSAPTPDQADNIELLAALIAGALRRERLERTLRTRATHDPLTQLPNRASLDQHLGRAVARARRQQQLLAVGLLDLDDFKPVNDQWGHAAGDALLRAFAARLQQALRDTDFVCRLGGDEFVLVLEGLSQPSDLHAALERLHAVVQAPFALPGGHNARVGMSLGVALYPEHGTDADGLLRAADGALYACKTHKAQRRSWWQLAGQEPQTDEPAPRPAPLLPYGADARRLLPLVAAQLSAFAADFVQRFYAALSGKPQMQAILDALHPADRQRLHQSQQARLQMLLSADLDETRHRDSARKLGQVHALSGVSTDVLVEALETYLEQAIALIQRSPLREPDRQQLQHIVAARIRVELQSQAQGEQEVAALYTRWIEAATQSMGDFVNPVDFMHWVLDELQRLPGLQAAVFGRPDAMGKPVVEFSTPRFDAYVAHFERKRQDYLPEFEAHNALAQASQVRAWRSERIETVHSFFADPRALPWREAAEQGHMAAILTLYGAYPNQFESRWMQHDLMLIGQLFSRAWAQGPRTPARVLPERQRLQWRALLNPEGLEMLLQPIVDLRAGRVARVEALARLRTPDGQHIAPSDFLPCFGASEITRLFTLGLDKALAQLRALDEGGLRVELSVNLPPEALMHPDCAQWISQALRRAGLPADRLQLELLESAELHDVPHLEAAVRALSALGVRLEMDDLGSGYSSLLRLRQLPFRAVKIDQGLVREAEQDPRRVIGFIGSLIRLAHTLDLDVVVEGLESAALVETAAVLGADHGQGFALARPMTVPQLLDWQKGLRFTADRQRPRTALGALATHWLWESSGRNPDDGQTLHTPERCPLSHYLRQQGWHDGELGRIHARMHQVAQEAGLHSAQYRAIMIEMVSLLMAQERATQTIQDEATGAPIAPAGDDSEPTPDTRHA
jgi:diguanylate cyclase (GGDEF)-like protein/PAS domain S-box-containing protein